VVILFLPVIHTSILFLKNFKIKEACFALGIIALVFSPNLLFHANDLVSLANHRYLSEWSFHNFFRNEFSNADGNLSYFFPNIIFVTSNMIYPGFIFPGVLFLIYFRSMNKRSVFKNTMVAMILLYAVFIAGIPFQNQRFMLLTFTVVLVLFSASYFRLSDKIKKWGKPIFLIIIGLTVAIQLTLCYKALKPFYENSRDIRYVSDKMRNYPGKTIYTFNIDMVLKSYHLNNVLINLWSNRINCFIPGSLVLINKKNILEHWQGMNPMINWESLNQKHSVRLIESMPGGWELYEICN
jgi:hypothetical protein